MTMPVIFLNRGEGLANITIIKYIISMDYYFVSFLVHLYSGILKGIKITYFTLTVSVV